MHAFFASLLWAIVLFPSLCFGKDIAGDHEFRLSPLERQNKGLIAAMTGGAHRETACGSYVAIYVDPVTRATQVLFAIAKPSGEPYQVIGRRARDIVFRNAPGSDLPTVVGTFLSDETVTRYVLYLPEEEFIAIRQCLKPRQADNDRDL